ncbi:MAG: glycosyltransferase [Verrucomicrobia bacterium]|nr:glycosyltransferase [Verrucomicrobiota bacterium]
MNPSTLTVLIPCLNEELGIAEVVREYSRAFPYAEILVVDNGSEDSTADAAREAGALVLKERRRGKARAVATALEQIDTDLVLMVDGDGSYPAAGARLLLDQFQREPADMISGIRSAQDDVFRPLHQWGMSVFASVLNLVFGFKPLDLFSGLRLLSGRFYQHVPVLSRGFELEIELTIQAIDKGFSLAEVPVPFCSRTGGSRSKLRTVHDGLRILRLLAVLFRDYRPFAFFGTLGGLLAFAGLTAGSLPIAEFFRTGQVGRFPLAILAASLVSLAILLALIGTVLQANLRYHREAYHIQLRKFRAPSRREQRSFARVLAS